MFFRSSRSDDSYFRRGPPAVIPRRCVLRTEPLCLGTELVALNEAAAALPPLTDRLFLLLLVLFTGESDDCYLSVSMLCCSWSRVLLPPPSEMKERLCAPRR